MAIFLGLIQGITEFLPISSSGHLSILQNFFGMQSPEEGHLLFDVLLHLATLISVCVVYRKDILAMIREILDLFKRKEVTLSDMERKEINYPLRLALMIVLATLPLLLVLPIKGQVEKLYYSTFFIGFALIATGFILYISDKIVTGRKNEKNITVGNALVIGLCQAIAVIPGLSRSGTTITAGMATGLNREFAVKFSFLISLPAILGANLISLFDALKEGFDVSLLPAYLTGMAAAMVSGYFAIGLVRFLSNKGKFGRFSYYCWAVGLITIILSLLV
ncbi:MAG TPA: undecaprenyl-diphosphate phosphatase [Clostridiales bacterium]|nr:undecaprenyl-diphosphate phosphatase [Clostridiales bacterium]